MAGPVGRITRHAQNLLEVSRCRDATWTQLNALVESPPHPAERDHHIRLFFGSGMPRGLWRRVCERFAPASELEMWGSSWQATSSLFRRDADGDSWLEGVLDEVIQTTSGPVLPGPVAAVFEELPNVTSAVAYPLTDGQGTDSLAVAVSVRKDIGPAALTAAAWRIPEAHRPAVVHVVGEMPLSSAGRPAGTAVRRDGIDLTRSAWRYDRGRDEYRPLTKTALAKLAGRTAL